MIKPAKFFRKQAEKAERMAQATPDQEARKICRTWRKRIAARPPR